MKISKEIYNHPLFTAFDEMLGKGIQDFLGSDMAQSNPLVNIIEKEDSFILDLAAPGLSKEDFLISLEKNQLTIESKKEKEMEHEKSKFLRKEYSYNSFKRSFTLPNIVDKASIHAEYDHGVLHIMLSKKDAEIDSKVKEIKIK